MLETEGITKVPFPAYNISFFQTVFIQKLCFVFNIVILIKYYLYYVIKI